MDEKMIIDYREEKIKKYFPTATIENLLVGDIVEDGFCIERKSAQDFLSSILNHHIFNQALNIYDNYPGRCVIIVESDLKSLPDIIYFSKIPNITIEGVRGAIASLYVKYHVPVLFASTRNGFVEMVNKLLEKNKENEDTLIYDPPISKSKSNPKLQILLQVPKIGLKKAKKILDHYATFENLKIMERPKGVSQSDIDNILEVLR